MASEIKYSKQPSQLGQLASQRIIDATKGGRQLAAGQEQSIYDSVLGLLTDQVPPGSQIVEASGARVVYRDPEGYETVLTRNQNGNDANFGFVSKQTNRPAILPTAQQQAQTNTLDRLYDYTNNYVSSTPSLASLDPDTLAALKAIDDAEQAQLKQQFDQQSGELLARLYGNGINRSTPGNAAVSQLLQGQSLATAQQQANAAGRNLASREYLTNVGQQKNQDLLNLLTGLSGQANTRDIANSGYELDAKKLDEMIRQFNNTYSLEAQKQLLSEQSYADSNSFFNKFLKTLQAGGQAAQGVGTALAGLG
jgi:hypothetical protein